MISSDSSEESVGTSNCPETPTIPPVVSTLPHTSPFLYTDSSNSDTSERPPLQDPYEILPTPPDFPRRPAILVLLGQSIPVGRPYHTQPNSVRKMLTVRKRVRALPSGRLASDHSSLDYFLSDDSSSDSPPDSSSGYSSDTSSGRSISDSSFDTIDFSFTGPFRKKLRSPIVSVPLATPVPEALSPVHADLLPPRKRIRGAADIDGDTTTAEAATTREADVRVEVGIGSDGEEESEEEAESEDKGTIKIRVDKVIKSVQRDQGHRILATSQRSAVMLDRIGVLERDNMRL
nr:hypothetical protein [Tanacetum cinerariifolium]